MTPARRAPAARDAKAPVLAQDVGVSPIRLEIGTRVSRSPQDAPQSQEMNGCACWYCRNGGWRVPLLQGDRNG